MKNKFLLLSLLFVSAFVSAQTYAPFPWGSGPPENDNTGRILTYNANTSPSIVYATKDTVKLYPNQWETLVQPSDSVADTITYTIPGRPASLYNGAVMKFYGLSANGSNHMIRFRIVYGSGVRFLYSTAADSTLTLTSKKHYYISFQYDGHDFIETGKSVGQ
jgi:hypothetical protein